METYQEQLNEAQALLDTLIELLSADRRFLGWIQTEAEERRDKIDDAIEHYERLAAKWGEE